MAIHVRELQTLFVWIFGCASDHVIVEVLPDGLATFGTQQRFRRRKSLH